jgi:hypothetical protein
MNLLGSHQAFELFRAIDTGSDDHRSHLLQNQVYRLNRARRLLGEDNTEIGHFLPGASKRLFAPVPDRKTRSNNDNDQ